MRMSDWSSDVCSSDLRPIGTRMRRRQLAHDQCDVAHPATETARPFRHRDAAETQRIGQAAPARPRIVGKEAPETVAQHLLTGFERKVERHLSAAAAGGSYRLLPRCFSDRKSTRLNSSP